MCDEDTAALVVDNGSGMCKVSPLNSVMPEPGGPGGPLPSSQYFADQLTLFQLGEGRLSPTITTGPPKLFNLPASLKGRCYLLL